MPRATPGVSARGVLRWKRYERLVSLVQFRDRRCSKHLYRWEMERFLHQSGIRFQLCGTFTLHSYGYGVERGCLGEVVSLVGDCRPPPPGNPHRLPFQKQKSAQERGGGNSQLKYTKWSRFHELKSTMHGELLAVNSKHHTFNTYLYQGNLKKLNRSQYFKKNRSFFSCIGNYPVLEFEQLHSHLCGLKVVELPSMAVTNVLEL
jgi:hypothetical protein